jgi:hypothetical protein
MSVMRVPNGHPIRAGSLNFGANDSDQPSKSGDGGVGRTAAAGVGNLLRLVGLLRPGHRAAVGAIITGSRGGGRGRRHLIDFRKLPDRHGSLRRRPSPEPQTRIAWSRCQVDAGQICPPL